MAGKNYRDLIAWQKAMDLVMMVYRASERFPKQEMYVLTSQILRAAVSVASNISAGQGRRTKRDVSHFLFIAVGSIREAETQAFIANRLGYINEETTSALIDLAGQACRLTTALANSLSRGNQPTTIHLLPTIYYLLPTTCHLPLRRPWGFAAPACW